MEPIDYDAIVVSPAVTHAIHDFFNVAAVLVPGDPEYAGIGALSIIHVTELLRSDLDEIQRLAVVEARAAGKTWTEIGRDLGISKQAAHWRFGDPDGRRAALEQPVIPTAERESEADAKVQASAVALREALDRADAEVV